MGIRDLLLLVVVGISLPFCFLRPVYGVVLWTILGFLNPQAFTWGMARSFPLAEAVAVATSGGFLFKVKFKRLFCREMCLLGVLWLWFTVTTLNSVHTPILAEKAADAWFRWRFVSKILLMTTLSVGIVYSRRHLRWLLLAIAGSFALLVFHAIPGMVLSGGEYRVYGPDNSMVADNTAFGLALDMALPFFFYMAKTETNRHLKWFLGLAFVACIPAIFLTYSRGAVVGLVTMSACMILLSNQKRLLIPVALLAVVLAASVAPQKLRDRLAETTDIKEASAMSRINAWTYSWNLANDYPIAGGGFEAYTPALFARYAPNPKDVHGPHSIYFGVLLEHGFVGLFLYFLLVADCFVVLHRIVKLSHLCGDEQSAYYANMLRFSLVGFLSAGAFLGRTYFDFYFMVVACTAILKQVCYEDWASAADLEDDLVADEDSVLQIPSHAGV